MIHLPHRAIRLEHIRRMEALLSDHPVLLLSDPHAEQTRYPSSASHPSDSLLAASRPFPPVLPAQHLSAQHPPVRHLSAQLLLSQFLPSQLPPAQLLPVRHPPVQYLPALHSFQSVLFPAPHRPLLQMYDPARWHRVHLSGPYGELRMIKRNHPDLS